MRFRYALGLVPSLCFLACSSGVGLDVQDPPSPPTSRVEGTPAPEEPPSEKGVTVTGRAVLSDGSSGGLREIVVVDADGEKKTAYSDKEGSFSIENVGFPYDIAVAPRAPTDMPRVYLGLDQTSIELLVYESRPVPRTAHHLRVQVAVPPCPTDGCWLNVLSESETGSGGATVLYPANLAQVTVEWTHNYRITENQETATVHVFNTSRTYSNTFYGKATVGLVSNGSTTLSPQISFIPSHVVDLTLNAPAGTEGWHTSVNTRLKLPGSTYGVSWAMAAGSFSFGVPEIAGATISASAWFSDPVEYTSPWDQERRYTAADVLSQPIGTKQMVINVERPIAMQKPTAEGTLEATEDIEWSGPSGTTLVSLYDLSAHRPVVQAYTEGKTLSRAQLLPFGIAIEPGLHRAEVSTSVGITMPELVARGGHATGSPSNTRHVFRFVAK